MARYSSGEPITSVVEAPLRSWLNGSNIKLSANIKFMISEIYSSLVFCDNVRSENFLKYLWNTSPVGKP